MQLRDFTIFYSFLVNMVSVKFFKFFFSFNLCRLWRFKDLFPAKQFAKASRGLSVPVDFSGLFPGSFRLRLLSSLCRTHSVVRVTLIKIINKFFIRYPVPVYQIYCNFFHLNKRSFWKGLGFYFILHRQQSKNAVRLEDICWSGARCVKTIFFTWSICFFIRFDTQWVKIFFIRRRTVRSEDVCWVWH